MPHAHPTFRLRGPSALFSALWLSFSLLAGCAAVPVAEPDPAALFKEAEQEIDNDHYILATEKLRTIRNKFPYSQFAPLAQLKLADVLFLQESFTESATAYETFRDLYPKHERAPYALLRIGQSYSKETPDEIARDLSSANRALDAYRTFVKKYPSHELAGAAAEDTARLELLLARKEKYVADFYLKRGQTAAARARYEALAIQYPKTEPGLAARAWLDRAGTP